MRYFGEVKLKNTFYKPWCDEDDFKNIFFVSSHAFEARGSSNFYPGSGSEFKNTKVDDDDYPGGILNIPFSKKSLSVEWRMKYLELVFPRLLQFKPDFILISAGFDGHERDLLGDASNISLNEFDYAWLTRELVKISNI